MPTKKLFFSFFGMIPMMYFVMFFDGTFELESDYFCSKLFKIHAIKTILMAFGVLLPFWWSDWKAKNKIK